MVLLLGIWAFYMISPAYSEYRKARQNSREAEKVLLMEQRNNEVLREENHRLRNTPRAIERVAREKFGWSKENEKIYDFSN